MGESGSEVSYFNPEPKTFVEVNRLSDEINKPWLKSNLKEIPILIKNQTLIFKYPEKGEPVTPIMDVYKAKIQYDGSLDKLNLRIVVRGYLQNKELVGYTWSKTASMRTLKCFLVDSVHIKARVHQLAFIGELFVGKS